MYALDDNEEAALKRKSWGDSGWFCPVALKEQMILWPGNQDIAMKYLEKFYCFSTEETKQKFYTNSKNYVAHDKPLKVRKCFYMHVYIDIQVKTLL